MSEFLIALALLGAMAYGISKWRRAVWGALLLMVFEGALRKWAFPGYQAWVFFAKDALLLGAYCGYFLRERMMRGRSPIRPHIAGRVLFALAGLCAMEVLNPKLPSIALGLVGMQNYLFYVPLMYMVPELLPDLAAARKFALAAVAVAAVPLLLGPVQFALPASHPLNAYAWTGNAGEEIATFGVQDHARITSTFSYITGYDFYLEALFVLALALALLSEKGWRRNLLFGLLGLTVVNLLMTGSRAPLLFAALAAPVVVLLSLSSMKKRDVKRVLLALVMVPVLIGGAIQIFPEALDAFIDRAQTSDDAGNRMRWFIDLPFAATERSGMLGWGTGASYQGIELLVPRGTQWDAPPPSDSEWEKIVYDIGPIGLGLALVSRLLISAQLWIAYRRSDRSTRPMIVAAFALSLIYFPNSLTLSHTAALLYYFFAGFAFLRFRDEQAPVQRPALRSTPAMLAPGWSRAALINQRANR